MNICKCYYFIVINIFKASNWTILTYTITYYKLIVCINIKNFMINKKNITPKKICYEPLKIKYVKTFL